MRFRQTVFTTSAFLAAWLICPAVHAGFEVFTTESAYNTASGANSTTIDFEAIVADGTSQQVASSVSGSLLVAGVDFSIDGSTSTSTLWVLGKSTAYADNAVLSGQYYNTSSDINIVVKLPGETTGFGIELGSYSATDDPVTITLSSGESFTTTAAAYSGLSFVGFVSDTSFTSIKISDPTAATNHLVLNVDNFRFKIMPVPTPSSLAILVVGGLTVVGGVRQRTRSQEA